MSIDEIEIRYCQYVDEVLNRHHLDGLATYMAADVVSHSPGLAAGWAGARELVANLVSAFPDFHLTIDALAAADGGVIARLTATGTHVGAFLGVAPTGRRFRVPAFGAWQLRDGACTEQWLQLDVLELLQQLGRPGRSRETDRKRPRNGPQT
jgi:steroid delta-isomerase-like uncharacterized protein